MDPELYGRLVVVDLARVADPEVMGPPVEVLRRHANRLKGEFPAGEKRVPNLLVVEHVVRGHTVVLQPVPLGARLGILDILSV